MSEAVERRILELPRHPTQSPYGNPIPGLEALGAKITDPFPGESIVSLSDLQLGPNGASAVVRRIGEPTQTNPQQLYTLRHGRRAARRGRERDVVTRRRDGRQRQGGRRTPARTAAHVFVAKH